MDIQGKVALVLGAVKGIGKAVGLSLAEQGARVILTRHDWADSYHEMEADFAATGAEYHILNLDLRETASAQALAEFIQKNYGQLDIFINNIERGGWPTVHGAYVEDQWDLEIETTLKAKRWIFDAVFPLLQAAPEACVINFSSIAALTCSGSTIAILPVATSRAPRSWGRDSERCCNGRALCTWNGRMTTTETSATRSDSSASSGRTSMPVCSTLLSARSTET